MRIALAAAVAAVQVGHQVTVMEASRALGGRARAIQTQLPDGTAVTLDNGQHILIGAYTESLGLMQLVGVTESAALHRQALSMPFADGAGLHGIDVGQRLRQQLAIERELQQHRADDAAVAMRVVHGEAVLAAGRP